MNTMQPYGDYLRDIAREQAERREEMLRAAVIAWLPQRLRWLVDRPRLLRVYLALPHRRRPTLIVQYGHPDRVELR